MNGRSICKCFISGGKRARESIPRIIAADARRASSRGLGAGLFPLFFLSFNSFVQIYRFTRSRAKVVKATRTSFLSREFISFPLLPPTATRSLARSRRGRGTRKSPPWTFRRRAAAYNRDVFIITFDYRLLATLSPLCCSRECESESKSGI